MEIGATCISSYCESLSYPEDINVPMETGATCISSYCEESLSYPEDINIKDACERGLGESVSFGRFKMDTFSWVKKSSFNHNQYQEELGNCSMPGSVAEKKAYFEAYYRELAKRKALERALAEGLCVSEDQDFEEINNMDGQQAEIEQSTKGSYNASLMLEDLRPVDIQVFSGSFAGKPEEEKEVGNVSLLLQIDAQELANNSLPQIIEDKEEIASMLEFGEQASCGNIDHILETPNDLDHATYEEQLDERNYVETLDKYEVNKQSNHEVDHTFSLKEPPYQEKSNKKNKTKSIKSPRSARSVARGSKLRPSSITAKSPLISVAKEDQEGVQHRRISKVDRAKGSLQRPLEGKNLCSKHTVPEPFALATDKRASVVVHSDRDVLKTKSGTVCNSSHPLSSNSEKTQVPGNMDKKFASIKSIQRGSTKLSEEFIAISKKSQIEAKRLKDEVAQLNALQRLTCNSEKNKPDIVREGENFQFKSDARAQKRREFNSKLEERLTAREEEKNQAQAKTQEQAEAEMRRLRKSLAFKATPMPTFYKDSVPQKTEIKKMPPTRARSPKLGRRTTVLEASVDMNAKLLRQPVTHKSLNSMQKASFARQSRDDQPHSERTWKVPRETHKTEKNEIPSFPGVQATKVLEVDNSEFTSAPLVQRSDTLRSEDKDLLQNCFSKASQNDADQGPPVEAVTNCSFHDFASDIKDGCQESEGINIK